MIRCAGCLFTAMLLVLVTGCPLGPAEPPAEAVLEGTWSVVPTEPGAIENATFEAIFDSDGQLTTLTALRDDGATATLSTAGSVTSLDGRDVTISVQGTNNTSSVFKGMLSVDQNTMTGSITQSIDLGDLELVIPGGDLTFSRVVDGGDPCDDVTCDPGSTCVDGTCVDDDPCEGVTCDPGATCVDGTCVVDDPCNGVTCDPGSTCVDGTCVVDDPCEGVTCDPGESCVDGNCVPQEAEGDPVAGEAYYMANDCAACHGDDATGPPSLIGTDAARIFDKLSGNASHVGGTREVTEQDSRDLEAWFASL